MAIVIQASMPPGLDPWLVMALMIVMFGALPFVPSRPRPDGRHLRPYAVAGLVPFAALGLWLAFRGRRAILVDLAYDGSTLTFETADGGPPQTRTLADVAMVQESRRQQGFKEGHVIAYLIGFQDGQTFSLSAKMSNAEALADQLVKDRWRLSAGSATIATGLPNDRCRMLQSIPWIVGAVCAVALRSIAIANNPLPPGFKLAFFLTLPLIACAIFLNEIWGLMRMIRSIQYDGTMLRMRSLAAPSTIVRALDQITEIAEWSESGWKHGVIHSKGYRIRFGKGEKVYLESSLPEIRSLIARLREDRWPHGTPR
jgi:hypothetical protein